MASSPRGSDAGAGERRELPLICFTLLSPASVGVVCGAMAMGKTVDFLLALVALVLVSAGMAGSILHLARPLMAPTSLRNVASSCLSREIVVVSAYWVVALAWCACCLLAPGLAVLAWALCLCTMAMGCALIVAIGNAYLLASQPAWNGREVYVELVGVAASVGGPAAASVVVLEALFRGSTVGSLLIAIAAGCILSAIGAALGHIARRARVKRLAQMVRVEQDAGSFARNPRVLEAQERLQGLAMRYRRVHVLSMIGILAGVVPPVALVVGLVSQALARDAFYRLRVTSRYAVRLHRW